MTRPVSEPMAIVVMGVSGCGKSTLGRALAAAMGCPFLEGDAFHDAAAVAKMSAGHPLSDADRAPWLDRIGNALDQATATGGRAVAACSALRRAYRDRLRAAVAGPVRFVLLDGARDDLAGRVAGRSDHYMPASLIDSQLATLERPDADEDALILPATDAPDRLTAAALAWLADAPPRPATPAA